MNAKIVYVLEYLEGSEGNGWHIVELTIALDQERIVRRKPIARFIGDTLADESNNATTFEGYCVQGHKVGRQGASGEELLKL